MLILILNLVWFLHDMITKILIRFIILKWGKSLILAHPFFYRGSIEKNSSIKPLSSIKPMLTTYIDRLRVYETLEQAIWIWNSGARSRDLSSRMRLLSHKIHNFNTPFEKFLATPFCILVGLELNLSLGGRVDYIGFTKESSM